MEFLGPIFQLKLKELAFFDCKFGFLVKNCIYRQPGMSRIIQFDENAVENGFYCVLVSVWVVPVVVLVFLGVVLVVVLMLLGVVLVIVVVASHYCY